MWPQSSESDSSFGKIRLEELPEPLLDLDISTPLSLLKRLELDLKFEFLLGAEAIEETSSSTVEEEEISLSS